ncbi:winged helix-turn-helix transcriptional regulator [Streptococcus macacae]|uniref:Transcriptional regulator, HxlR family n=1 Tax=Streptococcus macacae NCTC 11558 TaxID=764298 RepID=G5JWR1_9STRE|nr:helix-turn-helix domain-containing protein [Streptococcus macacae]EHJ51998.1 transcriptional regulator, HxlR family [Streptococcus macacae NCTC 11558]SUN79021.1 transcriptional regulator protein [Streptococcus macacae NCTC 11558]
MRDTQEDCPFGCAVEVAMDAIGGRWKGAILFHLADEKVLRFGELRKRIPGINQRMLTNQLRKLEECGIIKRTVFPVVPPRVDYELTEFGETLKPILFQLKKWGHDYIDYHTAAADN